MKRLFLFSLIMIISVLTFSQTRENPIASITYIDSSEILYTAIGWKYNIIDEKWVSNQNVISSNPNASIYMKSDTKQNFISIQTKSVIYRGSTYYAVFVSNWDGDYKYRAIHEDYVYYKMIRAYIFTESEFLKIKNCVNSPVSSSIRALYFSWIPLKNDNPLIDKYDDTSIAESLLKIENSIKRMLANPKYQKFNKTEVFAVSKSQEGTIRFYVPQRLNTLRDIKRYAGKYTHNYNTIGYTSYGDSKIYSDFEESYFETSVEEFSKILIK